MKIVYLDDANTILLKCSEIYMLFGKYLSKIESDINFINIKIEDTNNLTEELLLTYKEQLESISKSIQDNFLNGSKEIAVDVITDIFGRDNINFDLHLYMKNGVGSLSTEYNDNIDISDFTYENSKLCKYCYCFQCTPNPILNANMSGDVNFPPKLFCEKSFIEMNISREFHKAMKEKGYSFTKEISDTNYSELLSNSMSLEGNNLKGVKEYYAL